LLNQNVSLAVDFDYNFDIFERNFPSGWQLTKKTKAVRPERIFIFADDSYAMVVKAKAAEIAPL